MALDRRPTLNIALDAAIVAPNAAPKKTRCVRRTLTARRRFGYRRVHDLLRPDFPSVNHKRVYRLYTEANLTVRKRKKIRRPPAERTPLNIATKVNEVWSMDFVSVQPSHPCLTTIGE